MRTWVAFLLVGLGTVPAATAAVVGWSRPAEPVAAPTCARARFTRTFDVGSFSKGNLHAHTSRSDGDSPPEDVIGWYRRAGYAFLAITDHNRFFEPARFEWLTDPNFVLLPGEEVTMTGGGRQVHVNALCTKQRIPGGTFGTAGTALEFAIDQVQRQGGVAIVNHPNFDHALSAHDLLSARGASLLEVMSGHPYVYSDGTATRPAAEALWDYTLEQSLGLMAVAVDDEHRLRIDGDPPAYAGRGWVEVFGAATDRAQICGALRDGRLYASSGASLERIAVTETAYSVWPSVPGATVTFLGASGKELEQTGPLAASAPASHILSGDESYVRAKIVAADGSRAWTPAVSVTRSTGQRCEPGP